MASQATIDAIAAFGTVVAGALMASQLPAMAGVVMKRPGSDINKMSAAPTIGQAANFISWSVYAIVFGDMNLGRVNFIGCGFSLGYFLLFAMYTSGQARKRFFQMLAAFVVVMVGVSAAIIAPLSVSHDTKVRVLGFFATGCNVVMYVGPLDACRATLKEMDPARIPILLTVSGLACSCTWFSYGFLTSNWFVAGPNIAGAVLSSAQLAIAGYVTLYSVRGGKVRLSDVDEDSESGQISAGLLSDEGRGTIDAAELA